MLFFFITYNCFILFNYTTLIDQLVHIKKSHLDVLFTLDINNNYFLKVVVFIEEFDLENTFNSNKDLPDNVNLFADIQKLLKGVHDVYLKRRKAEAKLTDNDKIQASSAYNKKFETTEELQSFLAFRDSRNFLLRKRIPIDNFYSYINDDKPTNLSIIKALRNLDAKKLILKQNNYKKNKAKELKPTNIDLSKIPTNQYEEEDVEEEYKPFLKPTSLTNPVSTLDKDTFLKHRRRRSAIAKPSKVPASILALYTEYQNVFANVKLSSLNKYSHMKLFKETISNDL